MRAKLINEAFGHKDKVRMQDIQTKSDGDHEKEIKLATTQAKIIKDAGKAAARAEAAEEVFGSGDISQIFWDRAVELGGDYVKAKPSAGNIAPIKSPVGKGEKIEREHKKEFFLPSERIKNKDDEGKDIPATDDQGGGFRRGKNFTRAMGVGRFANDVVWNDEMKGGRRSILPINRVNLGTGKNSELGNIHDVFDGDDTMCEVWKVPKPSKNFEPSYKLIIGSGTEPMDGMGNRRRFKHDQNFTDIFYGQYAQLVDYVLLKDLPELIRKYGQSMSAYVYK